MKSAHKKAVFGKVIVYAILILIAVVMIIPFLWMLSASIKSDREVFQMNPFVWIPANPRWDNYVKIWTKIPFGRFVGNTVYLTLIVTFLQLLTSSFAAYSFAKLVYFSVNPYKKPFNDQKNFLYTIYHDSYLSASFVLPFFHILKKGGSFLRLFCYFVFCKCITKSAILKS